MIMNKLLILLFNLNYINVLADTEGNIADNFCTDFGDTLKLVSISVLIVRILVPFLLIFMATLDIYKAVTGGKSDELKKQITILGKRMIIGLMVFFIFPFVSLIVDSLDNSPSDYKVCLNCISNPANCPSKK